MDARSNLEKQELVPEDRIPFLSSAPQSGELSPFAQKLVAEAFVCLCSVVVFGSTANFSTHFTCFPLCRFSIAAGVISFLISLPLLVGQYLAWTNRIEKSAWISPNAEQKSMIFLSLWWTAGASCLSAPGRNASRHSPEIAIMFGWLALFGSIFGAYKAYHAAKEEERAMRYADIMSIQAAEDEEYANFS